MPDLMLLIKDWELISIKYTMNPKPTYWGNR